MPTRNRIGRNDRENPASADDPLRLTLDLVLAVVESSRDEIAELSRIVADQSDQIRALSAKIDELTVAESKSRAVTGAPQHDAKVDLLTRLLLEHMAASKP